MQDEELLRYSRQIMLPEFDIAGQECLAAAHVAIVGLGGLGSPVALYLAAAGVGRLTLIDDDTVELTNLQRQIVHSDADIGSTKVDSAARTLKRTNPHVEICCIPDRLDTPEALHTIATDADLLIDGTDNFATRHAMNRAALASSTPVVSGAAIRFSGQLTVFDPRLPESPCYACLYPDDGTDGDLNCSENGVIAPLVGVIGTLQAMEAIKILTGTGSALVGRLQVFDGLHGEWQEFRLKRNPACAVCGPVN